MLTINQSKRIAFGGVRQPAVKSWNKELAAKWNNADNADGDAPAAKPGQKMTISLTLNNASAGALQFELFNFLNSATRIQNPNYAVGAYAYIPFLSYEGIAAIIAATDGTIGFDKLGQLSIHGGAGAAKGIVQCAEIPYGSLFVASSVVPFQITGIRMTVTTDAQIDNAITYFQKTFGGSQSQQQVSPRTYFNPNQFQGKMLDLQVGFNIGMDTGLLITVNTGEIVKLSMAVQMWQTSSLVGSGCTC